jgi:hypothetical protein
MPVCRKNTQPEQCKYNKVALIPVQGRMVILSTGSAGRKRESMWSQTLTIGATAHKVHVGDV